MKAKQKSRLAVRLPDALRGALEDTAKRRFTSESEIVRVALLEKFERDGCPIVLADDRAA